MAAPTLYRLLCDVAEGLVTFDPSTQWIGVPGDLATGEGEAYRLAVVDALSRAQIMLGPGSRVLILTSLGEHFRHNANPGRYESPTAVEVRDGKVEQKAAVIQ